MWVRCICVSMIIEKILGNSTAVIPALIDCHFKLKPKEQKICTEAHVKRTTPMDDWVWLRAKKRERFLHSTTLWSREKWASADGWMVNKSQRFWQNGEYDGEIQLIPWIRERNWALSINIEIVEIMIVGCNHFQIKWALSIEQIILLWISLVRNSLKLKPQNDKHREIAFVTNDMIYVKGNNQQIERWRFLDLYLPESM